MNRHPSSPKLLFLLDYDGTLTDFSKNPDHSRLSPRVRNILKKLQNRYPVVFVTGRYLDSLERVSGLKGVPMIGTHGFEARNLPGGFRSASRTQESHFKKEAARLWKALGALKREFPEIHIEKKPYSSTLHYRGFNFEAAKEKKLRSRFNEILRNTVTPAVWDVMEGKKMIEAKPKGFSKGETVRKILRLYPGHLPVFAGDDITDISVFKILGKKGLKVSVGQRIPKNLCDLRFKTPKKFLAWLESF